MSNLVTLDNVTHLFMNLHIPKLKGTLMLLMLPSLSWVVELRLSNVNCRSFISLDGNKSTSEMANSLQELRMHTTTRFQMNLHNRISRWTWKQEQNSHLLSFWFSSKQEFKFRLHSSNSLRVLFNWKKEGKLELHVNDVIKISKKERNYYLLLRNQWATSKWRELSRLLMYIGSCPWRRKYPNQ